MAVYLITGATGYIGSMLTEHLLRTENDSEIIALCRNSEKKKERMKVFQADLRDSAFLKPFCDKNEKIDYIVHCASVTRSSEMASHPVETIQSIINATQNVLELARKYDIKSMVYLSSMEVYGDIDCSDGHRASEDEASEGRVEILRERSCYPLGKRMAENICYSYFQEYGVPVKIARLAQTFGRGVPSSDNRVFAQFARAVRADRDIVLHTDGRSMGNYCGIDDAVAGILTILMRGQNGEAYNVVNEENTMTILQMARLVADRIAGGRIGVRFEVSPTESTGYAADTRLRLSGEKLGKLGWEPRQKLADMYRELLEDMDRAD